MEVVMLIIPLVMLVLTTIIVINTLCWIRAKLLSEEDYEFSKDTPQPGIRQVQSSVTLQPGLEAIAHSRNFSSVGGSLKDSHKPMEILVEILAKKFDTQCLYNSEFAVLFLLSSRCLNDWIQSIEGGQYETDKYRNSVPNSDDDLTNYIIARPGGNRHAEVNILNRLGRLKSQYERKNFPHLESILLYTWIPPCVKCTQDIKTILGPYAFTHRVVVIYTMKDDDTTPAGAYEELKNMGIEVLRVNCPISRH